MKYFFLFMVVVMIGFFGCKDHDSKSSKSKHDSSSTYYKPGYGETMLNIQARHIKLWYAGTEQNWTLADFSIHEIEEALEQLQKYHPEKEETKYLNMIVPAIEEIEKYIKEKNVEGFKTQFEALTLACNTCHQLTKHDFIQIKIPDFNPYSNQKFTNVEVSTLKAQ